MKQIKVTFEITVEDDYFPVLDGAIYNNSQYMCREIAWVLDLANSEVKYNIRISKVDYSHNAKEIELC